MIYILPTDTCFGLACPISEISSYEKIYKIKKRSYDKPLAVLVEDYKWLMKYTTLNNEQIEFLKNYKKPFTILSDSSALSIWINFVDEESGLEFRNRDLYSRIAFRVANNKHELQLIKEHGPLFLTSANKSGKKEIYKVSEIREEFSLYIDKGTIKFIGDEKDLEEVAPSTIFEFIGDTSECSFYSRDKDKDI